MANTGDIFRDKLIEEIKSWNNPNIEIKKEVPIGYRFTGKPRYMDIVLRNKANNKFLAIEAKVQNVSGTAYQKLYYALEDCKSCPINAIIVFAGKEIVGDVKSRLIESGIGIEVKYNIEEGTIESPYSLFKQKIYIELGLNWFDLYEGHRYDV